jgi:hypothetical protein
MMPQTEKLPERTMARQNYGARSVRNGAQSWNRSGYLRKPHENKPKIKTGPKNGIYKACEGSYREARGRHYHPDGRIEGECWHCGKWCTMRDGLMPRHKELDRVVQGWDMPALLTKGAEVWRENREGERQ